MYKRRARVLFLSQDHRLRSQMAEGYARPLGDRWLEARSAGLSPTRVDPKAVALMAECGVDIADQVSRALTDEDLAWADLVVTFDPGARDRCPVLARTTQRRHRPIELPGEGAAWAAWQAVRERVRAEVEGMVGGLRLLSRLDEGP